METMTRDLVVAAFSRLSGKWVVSISAYCDPVCKELIKKQLPFLTEYGTNDMFIMGEIFLSCDSKESAMDIFSQIGENDYYVTVYDPDYGIVSENT